MLSPSHASRFICPEHGWKGPPDTAHAMHPASMAYKTCPVQRNTSPPQARGEKKPNQNKPTHRKQRRAFCQSNICTSHLVSHFSFRLFNSACFLLCQKWIFLIRCFFCDSRWHIFLENRRLAASLTGGHLSRAVDEVPCRRWATKASPEQSCRLAEGGMLPPRQPHPACKGQG